MRALPLFFASAAVAVVACIDDSQLPAVDAGIPEVNVPETGNVHVDAGGGEDVTIADVVSDAPPLPSSDASFDAGTDGSNLPVLACVDETATTAGSKCEPPASRVAVPTFTGIKAADYLATNRWFESGCTAVRGHATLFIDSVSGNYYFQYWVQHDNTTKIGTYWLRGGASAGQITRVEVCDAATKGQSQAGTYGSQQLPVGAAPASEIVFDFPDHQEHWVRPGTL